MESNLKLCQYKKKIAHECHSGSINIFNYLCASSIPCQNRAKGLWILHSNALMPTMLSFALMIHWVLFAIVYSYRY